MISSFEKMGKRHLILAYSINRSSVVDTFCGRRFDRLDGYAYINVPNKSEVCADCAEAVQTVAEKVRT